MKIGIDIGGSHIGIGVVDKFGKIIEKEEIRILRENKKNIEKYIEDFLLENIKRYIQKYDIESIGISSAGIIKDGVIIFAGNLGLYNYRIAQNLKEKLDIDIPIYIENDAKCAAMAEKEYGALKNLSYAIFLTLGTGIGGAIILNGKLMKSDDIHYFEFGHIQLKQNGEKCNCGKYGCFERYASMKTFKDILREYLQLDQQTSGKELINIIKDKQNDKLIVNIINNYIDDLSAGILILIKKFNIYNIIIGGSFVYYKDFLLNKLEEKLCKNNNIKIKIKIAELKNDAGIIGATTLKNTN